MNEPSLPTVKRLFTISRNKCAFPECINKIVDLDTGTILGQICHIKARNAKGPRYDPNQSDTERHAFDNLILMCSMRNKFIDDNYDTYTVEVLQKIKANHEIKSDTSIEIDDNLVQQLLSKSKIEINSIQKMEVQQINIGVSFAEARQIAQDVFAANFYHLSKDAENLVKQRANELLESYLREIASRNPESITNSKDPDMQYALYAAQRAYARSGNKDLADILVDILADRAKHVGGSLTQIVLNESIEIAPKLTPSHYDTLSVIFLHRYVHQRSVNSLNTFLECLRENTLPFLINVRKEVSHYQHLEYAGCGSIQLTAISLPEIWRRLYPGLFLKGVTIEAIQELFNTDVDYHQYIIQCLHENTLYQINAISESVIATKLRENNHNQEMVDKVAGFMKANLMDDKEIQDYVVKNFEESKLLFDVWENSSIKSFNLTSVGIAVAHANVRRKTNQVIDLSHWIKD
jgi:hypothetical protein